jgi:hypothetical protein
MDRFPARFANPMIRFPGVVWLWLLMLATGVAHAEVTAHILLQDSPLAGFQYHAGKSVWPEIKVGDALTLTREPDNPHDARAVRVDWRGRKLGYVPRRENADVARLLDNGQPLAARISRLAEGRDPWSRVRFEVVMPVQPDREGMTP